MKIIALVSLALLHSLAAAAPPAFSYQGLCDASAAVALGGGYFIVADDESNDLRVYQRGQAAPLKPPVPLAAFLHIKEKQESDIEGAAAIGDRIFWITSHGANKHGMVQSERRKFFATDIVHGAIPSVSPTGQPYDHLLDDMLREPSLQQYGLAAGASLPPKSVNAVNIEGLAANGNGGLLIGFRNPVPHGKALIIPLDNPDELIQGKRAKFGKPIELALGGLGIRSIERVGPGYYIVAGPIDKGQGALYQWSGQAADPAKRLAVDVAGLNPEALFQVVDNTLQVLSDDGTAKVNGQDCKDIKDKARQSFRSIDILPGAQILR